MNDPKLNPLLQQWREVEPRGDFDDCVRRRIRQVGTVPARSSWLDWLRQPALATAAALVIGLAAGTLSGIRSAPQPANELQFMAATTLAGAHLNLRVK